MSRITKGKSLISNLSNLLNLLGRRRLVLVFCALFLFAVGVDAKAADSPHAHAEHDQHDADVHATAEHDSHGEHGAPPIAEDLSFWSIIAFAGFCFAIAKLGLWKSLTTNMAAREERVNLVISTAEDHLAEVQGELKKHQGRMEAMGETVAETLAEARRDADYTQSEVVRLAEREAELMLGRAKHEIERSRDQSLHDLFMHLSKRVSEITEAKLRSGLQVEDQDRLIDETIDQLAASYGG